MGYLIVRLPIWEELEADHPLPPSKDDLILEAATEFLVRQDDGVEDDNFSRDGHIAAC